MTEVGLSEVVADPVEPELRRTMTAGMMMRNAREAAGLHVAALAVSMKIPVKKLEALEADRLELLHDAVFVRALASSVCRALKIDPAPVLDMLPRNTVPKLNSDERGINAPFHAAGGSSGISIPLFLSKPPVLVVLGLVLAGVAVFFFPDSKVTDPPADIAQMPTAPLANVDQSAAPRAPVEMVEVAAAPAQAMPSSPVLASVPSDLKAPPESRPASAPVQTVVGGTAPAMAASDVRRSSLDSAGTSGSMVVFKAKGPSWVKVVDAKGIVQLSKTLTEGEVVGASGTLPLSIVIGRVDVTDVEVRGKAFSLVGVAKDNVARFEVK